MDITNLLEKLGEALYFHEKEKEEALLAKEAVDYFAGMGIFPTDTPVVHE